jgi:hypothetical protein
MNTELAVRTIEALEPYARRLVAKSALRGAAYEAQWCLALQQARMVLAAFDTADPEPGSGSSRPGETAHSRSHRGRGGG